MSYTPFSPNNRNDQARSCEDPGRGPPTSIISKYSFLFSPLMVLLCVMLPLHCARHHEAIKTH